MANGAFSMNRIQIPDKILKSIIQEYESHNEATIPSLAKKYGYNKARIYKELKEKNYKLHKSGWNRIWQGYSAIGNNLPNQEIRNTFNSILSSIPSKYGKHLCNRGVWKWHREKILSVFLEEQNYKCAICSRHINKKTARIDHCHKTRVMRDLLCQSCNLAIGLLQDNVTTLQKALGYIKYHNKPRFQFYLALSKIKGRG